MKIKAIFLEEVNSTNDFGKELVLSGQVTKSTAIIAKTQTQGRGRLNERTWASVSGNFHGSFVINIKDLGIAENRTSSLNHTVISSVHEVLTKLANSDRFLVKLPNDILVDSKKIAGVLVDVLYPYSIIGIGINLIKSPIDISTDMNKEFNLLVNPEELVENLYESIIEKAVNGT